MHTENDHDDEHAHDGLASNDEATRTEALIAKRPAKTAVRGLRVEVLAPASAKGDSSHGTTVTVGRSPAADVRIHDATVSSLHAELELHPSGVLVRDLASTNGVLFAGARVREAVVPAGATLQLGAVTLRVHVGEDLPPTAAPPSSFGGLRGRSRAMRDLFAALARVARTDLSVLLDGPTGTGKELAARGLHESSARAQGPFVVLDCTAIPSTLAESVLFGHEKGAFTGAAERRVGVFEAASGGTVFLDEIGELSSELQPKLLRVLERREVVRVGSTKALPVDVRVVAATWRDLRAMTNDGRFREDLYYRLAQVRVRLPALRERSEDVPVLVRHFLEQRAQHGSGDMVGARDIDPTALEELSRREFPGNVRELRSVVDRAAMLASGPTITEEDLLFERMISGAGATAPEPLSAVAGAPASPMRDAQSAASKRPASPERAQLADEIEPFKDAKRTVLDEFERDYLSRLLERVQGNLTRAAAYAGVERHHLRQLLRKHGLRGDGA